MTKEMLNNLKKDLDIIKTEYHKEKSATKRRDRESIYNYIQFLTDKMIDRYKLLEYDIGIKMESHNPEYFIYDVENIIRDLEGKMEI